MVDVLARLEEEVHLRASQGTSGYIRVYQGIAGGLRGSQGMGPRRLQAVITFLNVWGQHVRLIIRRLRGSSFTFFARADLVRFPALK